MRGWLPAILLAVVAAIALGLALGASRTPSDAERADEIARGLRCPDCQSLSVADSPTESAAEIRRQIDDLVAAGASSDAVRDHFVDRYGEWILLAPASPVPWIVPFAVIGAAGAALAVWLARSRGRASPVRVDGAQPADDVRRRLRDEAEALDA
jgi:cytochrome c-type biogenesis protein CcmH